MSTAPSTSESAVSSSLQRSGLSITVGDTKSIVLALQALQSKIRTLEQDRDFHQDQYESALQAHERYKLDMERQLEHERAAHRTREAELLELLRRAREERAQLEDALNGNKEDLGGFRRELEQMIAVEKEQASMRESKLSAEVAKLRADIKDEQTHRAALLVTVDKLKEEREAALHTNEELRIAMDDLLTRYERMQEQQQQQRQQPQRQQQEMHRPAAQPVPRLHPAHDRRTALPPPPSIRRRSDRLGGRRVLSPGHVGPREPTGSSSARQASQHSGLHHNYEDPTCSSMLRDVRVAPDEAPPCAYPSVNSSSLQQHPTEPSGAPQRAACGTSTAAPRTRGGRPAAAAAAAARHRSASSRARTTAPVATPPRSFAGTSPARRPPADASQLRTTAMDEVEAQLRQELAELQHRYDDTVARGAAEEIPPEVVAAALQRLSALVDQKKEQLKLLKEARMELEAVAAATPSRPGAGGVAASMSSNAVTAERQTRRALLVNELRSLLAEAAGEGG